MIRIVTKACSGTKEETELARRRKNITPRLREGEELIWTGAPCEDKDCGRIDRLLLPAALVGLILSAVFAVALAMSVIRGGFAPYHIAGLALLLIMGGFSVYSYFLRFGAKRRAKADLVSGVTNQGRVLICDQAQRRMYEYESSQLRDAYISEIDRGGVGTIYLKKKRLGNLLDNTGLDFLGLADGARMALFDVPDCKRVLRLIRGR